MGSSRLISKPIFRVKSSFSVSQEILMNYVTQNFTGNANKKAGDIRKDSSI